MKDRPEKRWLSEFRDRFASHWSVDCAWERECDALAYTQAILNELEDTPKLAQSQVRNEETGEVPWEGQAKRCRNCKFWRVGCGYGSDYQDDALGYDPWKYQYKGVCQMCGDVDHAPSVAIIWSSGRLWTHEDFLCVLYERREENGDERESE